jgi:hypothetical protein
MAENTVPFSIEEAPAPISDDVAVQATPYMDALTIPDTDKPAVFQSIVQDSNKVDMDIEKIRGQGLETPQIARYLVENLYKYQDEKGDYQALPSGYYDRLRESGIPDEDILSTFANVRDLSPTQQFMEQAAISGTFMAGAMPGATAGAMVAGPFGFVVGGISGGLAADAYRRMMAPETELPYADKSGAAVAGEIFGGSVPGLSIPWLAKDSAISLGSNFIGNNLKNMPFAQPISTGLARGEQFLTQGFQSARNQPLSYVAAETRDVATAAAIGVATENMARGDRGAANSAADLLAETAVVMADPVGRVGRFVSNKVPVLRGIVEGLSPERRVVNAGMRLRKILTDAGEDPDALIPILLAGEDNFETRKVKELLKNNGENPDEFLAGIRQGTTELTFDEDDVMEYTETPSYIRLKRLLEEAGENPEEVIPAILAGDGKFAGTDYSSLLDEAGIDFNNRTAALQTGVPILYLLESAGLGATRRRLFQPNEIMPDALIQERHQAAQRNFNQFLADLIEMDTPESLGLFADLRDQNYRGLMNARLTDAFDRYQSTVNKALEGGETLDTQRVLYTTMFGEDGNGGVFGDIKSQERILQSLIPKNIDVPAGTLSIPDTEELAGEGLVDVFNRIGEEASIRGQRPRLSYGKDLVSLDVVLKEFDRFVNPEKYAKADDLPELPKEKQLNLPGMTVSTPDAPEIEDTVSTNELLNFLNAIDQAKKNALRGGNQPLLEFLTEIEVGAKNTLSAVSNHRNVTTLGGQFSRYFDNYLAYRDEASNVFSNAFLGEMRTAMSPELAGLTLFKGMGNPTLLRLQQMDDAANFLLSYNNRNMGNLDTANEELLNVAEKTARLADGDTVDTTRLKEMTDASRAALTGPQGTIPIMRSAQEKVLRGILNEGTFFKRTPVRDAFGEPTGETIIEPTASFETFMSDPVTQKILAEYFPALQSDLSDISKTRALFDNLSNENSLLNESMEASDSFTSLFRGVYDNPIATVQDIIGTPGERTMSRENPIRDLSRIARTVAGSKDPKVIQGFLDTILNHGYAYSGGGSPINPKTGQISFNPDKLRQYLFSPMVPGRRTTVVDVLRDTGVLEGGDAHLARISQVLAEMDKIQKAMSTARAGELGNIEAPEMTQRIQMQIAEAGVGAFGAGIASNFYGLLARAGIVGGAGSLITSALGARVAREVLTKNPAILTQQLMTEMLKDPRIMADILEMTKNYKPGDKLPSNQLRRMYTFLLGGGLVPAAMSYQEFGGNYYGRTMPEERQAEREEAGAAPMVPSRPNPRRVQPSIVPPPEPVTPPPQAAAPRPMPPPVAQAPAPTAQAPASPDQRARYAAMFPNDTASDLIRQGIGSLS